VALEQLGPPLNIDKYLDNAKDRINLIGVELEGGWFKLPGDMVPQRDGSIHFGIKGDDPEKVAKIGYIGEIPLPPLPRKELPATLKLYYPSYVNQTCGMHVHLSTTKAFAYQRLMVNKPFSYPGTIVEYMMRWAVEENLPKKHPIWDRLAGKSEYCQHVYQAKEQAKTANKDFDHHRPGHRYTVIHFCWGRFKTLECRLLPMMDTADQAMRAVNRIVSITNAFLAASKEREPRLRTSVVADDNDANIEERKSYV
jgi:hypothetical protein